MTDETTPLPLDDEISLLDLLLVVAENARLLIFGPLLAGLAALGIAFIIPPTFTATTRILPPQQQQGAAAMLATQLGALAGIAGVAGLNIKNPADTYVALIKSRTVAHGLIDRFTLLTVYDEKYRQEARKELEKRTTVSAGKDGLQVVVEAIARLKAQVTAQEIRLSTMRGSLTEENPQLQLAQREL